MGELLSRFTFRDVLPTDQRRLQYGADRSQTLIPCTRIEDSELQVGVLGLKNLKPERFRVRGARDRQPIVLLDALTDEHLTLSYPGKSASLYFGEHNVPPDIHELVQRSMQRPATRHDHLHVATVGSLDEVGWQTWWTPLPSRGNALHVRLVSERTVKQGSDPTESDQSALASVLQRIS